MDRLMLIDAKGNDIVVEVSDDLTWSHHGVSGQLTSEADRLVLTLGDTQTDVTADVCGAVVSTSGLSPRVVGALVRHWLGTRSGNAQGDVLWSHLIELLPGLARLNEEHGPVRPRTRFSLDEVAYLREAEARTAATVYFGDACGRSAGLALSFGAFVRSSSADDVQPYRGAITEDRIALMRLIADPALRLELAHARTAASAFVPSPAIGRVTAHLEGRAQIDFVKEALPLCESRLVIHAACRLGIAAEGTDGAASYHRLVGHVRASGFGAFGRPIDHLTQLTDAYHTVRTIESAEQVVAIGLAARNCLADDDLGWPDQVASGQVEMAVFDSHLGVEAIVALSARDGSLLDLKAPFNRPVAKPLRRKIETAIAAAQEVPSRSRRSAP